MFKVRFEVESSIEIQSSLEHVKSIICDFNQWPHWSPWLCLEPEADHHVQGEPGQPGHQQAWQGQRIGQGEMTLESSEEDTLYYTIQFIKPWKSQSKVSFILKASDQGTHLTWTLQGTLPIFMFWFKKMMIAWLSGEYERGLKKLKELSETGQVQSNMEIEPHSERKGFHYIALPNTCHKDQISEVMTKDFNQLEQWVKDGKLPQPQAVMSFYRDFKMVEGIFHYEAIYAYDQEVSISEIPQLKKGQIPTHQFVKVTHTGHYEHLANPWSMGMNYLQSMKIKSNKKIPPYEFYLNHPQDTASENLQVEICFPKV